MDKTTNLTRSAPMKKGNHPNSQGEPIRRSEQGPRKPRPEISNEELKNKVINLLKTKEERFQYKKFKELCRYNFDIKSLYKLAFEQKDISIIGILYCRFRKKDEHWVKLFTNLLYDTTMEDSDDTIKFTVLPGVSIFGLYEDSNLLKLPNVMERMECPGTRDFSNAKNCSILVLEYMFFHDDNFVDTGKITSLGKLQHLVYGINESLIEKSEFNTIIENPQKKYKIRVFNYDKQEASKYQKTHKFFCLLSYTSGFTFLIKKKNQFDIGKNKFENLCRMWLKKRTRLTELDCLNKRIVSSISFYYKKTPRMLNQVDIKNLKDILSGVIFQFSKELNSLSSARQSPNQNPSDSTKLNQIAIKRKCSKRLLRTIELYIKNKKGLKITGLFNTINEIQIMSVQWLSKLPPRKPLSRENVTNFVDKICTLLQKA